MNLTEELSVVSHEALRGLTRSQQRAERRKMIGLTITTPHRNISVDNQMLGRSLLRNTLLGTYQTRSVRDKLP